MGRTFKTWPEASDGLALRLRSRGLNPDDYYLSELLAATVHRPYRGARTLELVPDWYEGLEQYRRPALFEVGVPLA